MILTAVGPGSEGYFRDPGFDWNTVRDWEKRNIFYCKRDLTATQEAEFAKFLAQDAVNKFSLSNKLHL